MAPMVAQRDHGDAEPCLEGGDVERRAAGGGLLDQVQRHHHRAPELGELQGEGQVAGEVHRVDDVDDQGVGIGLEGGEDDVLLGAGAPERVGARQVDQVQRRTVDDGVRRRHLDGGAGPVADLEAAAGDGVDQAGLADVRRADEAPSRRAGVLGRTIGAGRRKPQARSRAGRATGGAAHGGLRHRRARVRRARRAPRRRGASGARCRRAAPSPHGAGRGRGRPGRRWGGRRAP